MDVEVSVQYVVELGERFFAFVRDHQRAHEALRQSRELSAASGAGGRLAMASIPASTCAGSRSFMHLNGPAGTRAQSRGCTRCLS